MDEIKALDLTKISANQKRSKKREFNDYSLLTTLVKKYKATESDAVMLEIITALEGIINTYTIMLAPGDNTQQIHLNPYMKKFLSTFLTPTERVSTSIQTYMQAVYRVRWIMRHYTYEDIYAEVIGNIVSVVKSMKIVGDCGCFYYIQLIIKYKMGNFVVKTAKDAMSSLLDLNGSYGKTDEEHNIEDVLDKLSLNHEAALFEDNYHDKFYNNIDISVILRTDDLFKYLTHYEKYIIYLIDYLNLTNKQILSILKSETKEDLEERISDIKYKLGIFLQEKD